MSLFLLSCGGTGGHLSPGISLAEGLAERGHESILLISRKRVDSRLIEKYPHLRFERMPGTGFAWNPLQLGRFAASQSSALAFCLRLIGRTRPAAVVGFGGFTSAPAIVAGRMRGVPISLHESNRVPGLAVRVLARLADRVYLPPGIRLEGLHPESTRHVGQPVRREFTRLPAAASREALGFDPNQKLVSVLGGSQGASVLNDWARARFPVLAGEGIQLCCVTGLGKGEEQVLEGRSRAGQAVRARFLPFCDRVPELLSASDLVISRAGAGTLAELIRCETPAILIPYPHAASDHQRANARFFERQGGGIVVEQDLVEGLDREVVDIVFNEWLLRRFRANLRRMDRANSLDVMLQDLEELGR